ncbi:hypothetical protein [Streptomyces sp. NRRL F-5123]|uniref:hypothetical protein n=1 Tax=Streptomyces sp. NRRL F-5123 TaxID=1463856 RepID=UPI0004E19007|nr:hypothetical protein [Streptomyces sp. NRRL F-5123]
MPPPSLSSRMTIQRIGVSRRLQRTVTDRVPPAARLVQNHFGRRPLNGVHLVLAKPAVLPQLAAEAQGAAAGVPKKLWHAHPLSITRRPSDLYGAVVIAPKGGLQILLNAKRLRRAGEIDATLVYAFIEIDQLIRRGALERRIALVRHEMHHHRLRRGDYDQLLQQIRAEEDEAEQLLKQLATRN